MVRRWLVYLAALAGCIVFYCAYREWFSWVLMMGALALPWFSLLVSLPAMLLVKLRPGCPVEVLQGTQVTAQLRLRCPLPAPKVRWQLRGISRMTGKKQRYRLGETIDTTHCGIWDLQACRVRVYDCLGLFGFPRRAVAAPITVLPQERPVTPPPELSRCRPKRWKPKPGGGFSENHELRLYRPGDSLRQIHWKLSAKTGKLVYREPVEPVRGKNVLCLLLCGTQKQLDEKLGELSWMMTYLLEGEVPHEVRCVTGNGLLTLPVTDEFQAKAVLRQLLGSPVALPGARLPAMPDATWLYRIGGGADEG